ncbi:UNVERIFIED_CONTAM: hypothetical protein Sradi_7161600 [Sesamum radiatum]|uniref:Uncharacterized protein n=1 Tax=Sesamum radiatum TaxID=300843 RepID=A0AAW2IVF9_SESRA
MAGLESITYHIKIVRLKMEDAFARTGAFITPRAGLSLVKRKSRNGKRRPWPYSRQLRLTYKPTQRLKY